MFFGVSRVYVSVRFDASRISDIIALSPICKTVTRQRTNTATAMTTMAGCLFALCAFLSRPLPFLLFIPPPRESIDRLDVRVCMLSLSRPSGSSSSFSITSLSLAPNVCSHRCKYLQNWMQQIEFEQTFQYYETINNCDHLSNSNRCNRNKTHRSWRREETECECRWWQWKGWRNSKANQSNWDL